VGRHFQLMSAYDNDRPRSKRPLVLLLLVVLIAGAIAGGIYLRPRFESQAPQIRLTPDTDVMGNAPLEISVTDAGAGLKSLSITLGDRSIAAEQFAAPVGEKKLSVALAKIPGVKEGQATLRIAARDASLWGWFKGNETVVQKQLTIDLTPPTVELVADDRYINFGGAGAIVYKTSADAATSGVRVGKHFFPGFPGQIKDKPDHLLVFFAHPYDTPPGTRAMLVSTDKAGNTRETPLVYELKDVKYRKSTLTLSDSFLQNTVAALARDPAVRQGSPKDLFVAVNKQLRKENEDRITAVTKKASPSILWKGAFTQLSNSKVEANFADLRTYVYKGEAIDTAYHVGYDLSVTKRYPVEAANSGAVVLAEDLGIYGNTVILDHGLGLFTLYSHLSAIDVKVGDKIEAKQVLGRTGETGLAGGDHLHYGVYLHGVAVLPVEWWDGKWINDDIAPKLEGQSGDEIAAAQAPKKSARGGKKRRR
jgi:murein DD-endopeptidase MepM/ murein hydrolase activator NlpD